jgi:uncharacterized protein YkwD
LKPAALAQTFALAAALVCAACAEIGMDMAASPPAAAPVDPKTQMVALEQRIFEMVQDERHKINPEARPLALDSELVGVARQRSDDMAQKKYIAHTSPDGVTSASLIMNEDQEFQGLLGENLAAQNYTRQSGVNVEACARRFVDTWLASPPHKDNLSYTAYERGGIGAAVNGETIYVTLLFATDLGLSHVKNPEKRQVSAWKDPQTAIAKPAAPSTDSSLRGTSSGP